MSRNNPPSSIDKSQSQYRKPRQRRTKHPDRRDGEDEDAQPTDPFPNYRPAYRVLLLEFVVLILLGIVVFGAPDGVAGVMGPEGSKVGLLRSCSGGSCSGWMGSSAGSSTTAASTRRNLSIRQDVSGSAGSSTSSSTSSSSSTDLTSFFLTTGLASIASFWLILYTFLLTMLRKWGQEPPPISEPKDKDKEAKKKRGLTICGCPCGMFSWCIPGQKKMEGLRRFAYSAGRIYVFVNFWLVVGITGSVTSRAMSSSPGTGLYLLYFAATILLLVAFIELSNEERRLRKMLLTRDWRMMLMCRCWCCCTSRKRTEDDVEMGERR